MKTKKQNEDTNTMESQLSQIMHTLERMQGSLVSIEKDIDITQKIFKIELSMSNVSIRREISNEIKLNHQENLKRLDYIVKEMEASREGRTITDHQITKLQKEMNDHEKRISKLEAS